MSILHGNVHKLFPTFSVLLVTRYTSFENFSLFFSFVPREVYNSVFLITLISFVIVLTTLKKRGQQNGCSKKAGKDLLLLATCFVGYQNNSKLYL